MKQEGLEKQLQELNHSPASEPDPQWADVLRTKLNWITENPVAGRIPPLELQPSRFSWLRFALYAGSALVLTLALGGGISLAAQNAMPNQLLYPVKIASEDMRRVLAADEEAGAKLELELADRRIEELKTMAREKTLDTATADAIQTRYQKHVTAALNAIPASPSSETAQSLAESIAASADAHTEMETELEVSFGASEGMDRLRQKQEELRERLRRVRDFARESREAADFMKNNNTVRTQLQLKVENDDEGRAHVKIEVRERKNGEEKNTVEEHTLPADALTATSTPLLNDDVEGDEDEDERGTEKKGGIKFKTDNKTNVRVETNNGTTTIFFDDDNARTQEILKNRGGTFWRFLNGGVQSNIQSEQSADGGTVEQHIETNVESESKIEFKSSREEDVDRD